MGRSGRIYRRVRATLADRPTNFGWIIDRQLAASGLPSSKSQVRWLSGQGINRFLTLTEEPLPEKWFQGTGISVKHVAMPDHLPPGIDSLLEVARYIQGETSSGAVVLVHCLAGKGRTGTVIAAYLMTKNGTDARSAIEFMRKIRPGSVEGPQEQTLYEFERVIRGGSRPL